MVPDEEQGVLPEVPHKGVLQPSLYQTPGILDVVPGRGFRGIVIFLSVDPVFVTCVGGLTLRPATADFLEKREIHLINAFLVLTIMFFRCLCARTFCAMSRPHNRRALSPARVKEDRVATTVRRNQIVGARPGGVHRRGV